jgi:hypothetical protein
MEPNAYTIQLIFITCYIRAATVAGRGRPRLDISDDHFRTLYYAGLTAPSIAELFGCSTASVYSRLYRSGLKMRKRYATISDADLQNVVSGLRDSFKNSGTEVYSLQYFHGIN